MKKDFDYEQFKLEAIEGLKSGKGLSGKDNVELKSGSYKQ